MAIKKTGLGRGLDVLIPKKSSAAAEDMEESAKKIPAAVSAETKEMFHVKQDNMEKASVKKTEPEEKTAADNKEPENGVLEVRLSQIDPNREQPRKNFEEDSLLELADSLRLHGMIQPLVVQKKGKRYSIIAGERRFRAAKQAGLKTVPVIVKEYTPQEVMEISLIENIQREELNPIEEAMAYKNLIDVYQLKQDDVAERVSKSRTSITNSMRLLKLDERVQQMVIDEMISAGHARALIAVENPDEQVLLANRIFEEKLSVREIEKLIQALKKPKKEHLSLNEGQLLAYKEIENRIAGILGSKVTLKCQPNHKGKISIDYFSMEELERIVQLLDSIRQEQ